MFDTSHQQRVVSPMEVHPQTVFDSDIQSPGPLSLVIDFQQASVSSVADQLVLSPGVDDQLEGTAQQSAVPSAAAQDTPQIKHDPKLEGRGKYAKDPALLVRTGNQLVSFLDSCKFNWVCTHTWEMKEVVKFKAPTNAPLSTVTVSKAGNTSRRHDSELIVIDQVEFGKIKPNKAVATLHFSCSSSSDICVGACRCFVASLCPLLIDKTYIHMVIIYLSRAEAHERQHSLTKASMSNIYTQ